MTANKTYTELAEMIRETGTLHRRAKRHWETSVWRLGPYQLFQTACGRESWIKRGHSLHVYLRNGERPTFQKGTPGCLQSGLLDLQQRPFLTLRPARRRVP